MKKNNKKGFTLAELLIVVAIIAVLVAVAIPVFNAQLEKSRDAVTVSNLRNAYAMAQSVYLMKTADTANGVTYTYDASAKTTTIEVPNVVSKGQSAGWSGATEDLVEKAAFEAGCADLEDTAGTYTITFVYDTDGKIDSITAA